jgi:hypothetical protein
VKTATLPLFDGPTYSPKLDGKRLASQLQRVRLYMIAGHWHTLDQIIENCGGTTASISARLRDLRKTRFGGYTVERRRVDDAPGFWEYRITMEHKGKS